MQFTPDWTKRYLEHRLGASDIEVIDIVRFPRGSSRETWFIVFQRTPAAPRESLVFRADLPRGSSDPNPLDREYFIYERLGQTSVPIAKALWWEDDPVWTDRPFYVREHIEGSWELPRFLDPSPENDDYRIEISKEHLAALARVHAVDWRSLGFSKIFSPPKSERDCGPNYVEHILQQIEDGRTECFAIAAEAAEWLTSNAPVAPRIVLCKGTNGLGEEVFHHDRLVAMSDWEEASIGDPAADFAFMQEMIPVIERSGRRIWDTKIALEFYRSISGIEVAEANIAYYGLIRAMRMLAFGHNAARCVSRYPDATVRQAWTATECIHIGKHILAAAIGILPPLAPNRFQELLDTV